MSAVWRFFQLDQPTSKTASCRICNRAVSRGGTHVGSFNTTNLIKHLKMSHPDEHSEVTAAKNSETRQKQQTLATSFQRREKFSSDSPRASGISGRIIEFIVLDDQPLSVVENVGFRRLMEYLEPRYCLPGRKYISETALPALYQTVCELISTKLKDVQSVSLTTDIWSSDVTSLSLLSLTAHWISKQTPSTFSRLSAVLHAMEFRGSHTAVSIAETLARMLDKWNIQKSSVHVILRDNASNMKKAMQDFGVRSLGCFAHSLQLVVHEGLLSQRSVNDALATTRKIVGHFKHSPLATSRLEDIQADLHLPTKRLQQDVPTRWNSTFYMLESVLEQKRSISAYGAEYELPTSLATYQWALLEKTVLVLAPFEELTRQISSSTSSLAEVIPSVTVLKRLLSRENQEDSGIKTMKTTLLEAINKRFYTIEQEPLYAVATLLDPRFKDRYFSSTENLKHAKEALISEMEQTEPSTTQSIAESPQKIPRIELEKDGSSLKGLFEEIIMEREEQGTPLRSTHSQLQTYLMEPTIPRSDSPFQYWASNLVRFPSLAITAAKFLSAPSTSVESERLFSAVSNILDQKRNRLGSERVEMLIFLKKNLPLYLNI